MSLKRLGPKATYAEMVGQTQTLIRQSARAGSLAAASAICRCIAIPLAQEACLAVGKSKNAIVETTTGP
jgi:hypothetical protein